MEIIIIYLWIPSSGNRTIPSNSYYSISKDTILLLLITPNYLFIHLRCNQLCQTSDHQAERCRHPATCF
jgi:hypothetical protein